MTSPNIHELEEIEQNFSNTLKSMYFGIKTIMFIPSKLIFLKNSNCMSFLGGHRRPLYH